MKQKYIDFFKQTEESNEHWTEIAISDYTDEICRLMDKEGINRTELADKIDSTPAYITKALRGNVNFTLATMTKLARALGAVVRVHLAPDDVIVRWRDEPTIDSEINILAQLEGYYLTDIEYVAADNPFGRANLIQNNSDSNHLEVVNG